jgi:hypothetical protein
MFNPRMDTATFTITEGLRASACRIQDIDGRMLSSSQHRINWIGLRDLNRYTGDGGKQKIKYCPCHPVVVRLITALLICIIKNPWDQQSPHLT